MEEKKVPALRFRGFDNAWEQRRLGEVATITMGQSPDGATYSDSPSKYILVQGNADLKDGWVFPRVWTTQKTKVCDKGDLIMSVRAPAGAMGKTAYNAVIGRGVAAIKGNEFIYQRLVKMDLCDYWKKLAAGSTFESINSDIIFNAEIAMPSGKEQKKIGSIFNKLDHLISLHQRKLEMLKKVKKSMLEKMFPKNDAKVPEVRFSDFTDAWEHCKLGDVFEQTSNLVTLGNGEVKLWSLTVEDGLTPKTERYNREFLVKKDDKFKEVRPGDIVYNPMNMTLGAVGYNGMTRSVAVSGYYTTMIARENYDAYYINTWLKSSQAIKLYKIYATGSLIEKQRVQFPTLSIISASFPRDEEQKQIGSTFEKVDTLISLHQRKLEKLKNIKKSMLEKMFII